MGLPFNRNIIVFLISLLLSFGVQAQYTITSATYDWTCQSSFPTAYQTVSFSIQSSGNGVFKKNQTNKTFTLTLSGNFEFKTTGSTAAISVAGNYLSIDSWSFPNANTITVQYDAANTNATDAINFNNFEIRATAAGSGNIYRNGGTAEIFPNGGGGAATTVPAATEYFGTFSCTQSGTYNNSAVTQASTANLSQYTINNEILRIHINVTGGGSGCGDITQFAFSTSGDDGTNLTSNISKARVYYTGSSTTFATTTLFGETLSPNGAFTVSGTQTAASGDNYFWLTYDVPGDANTGAGSNKLDAQMTSFTYDGAAKTDMSTPNPAGSRTIVPATAYWSLSDGNWDVNTRWSTAGSGGATCTCQPNGSGVVNLEHNVTLNADRTVDVIEIADTKTLSGGSTLTVNTLLKTLGSGKFTMTKAMEINGNMELNGTGASTCTKSINIDGDFTSNGTTSLTLSGAGASEGESFYCSGNLIVNGTLTQSSKYIVHNSSGNYNIGGSGTISGANGIIFRNSNKTIPSTASLTLTGDITIEGAYTVTNNGTVTTGNIDGNNASSTWINAANSTLNFGGTTLMNTGILTSSASGNTVNYTSGTGLSIKVPSSSQYANLTLAAGTKTLAGNIDISGTFTNNGTFTHGNYKVTFDGSAAQVVGGSNAPTFYNVEINNANGVTLNNGATVTNQLTLTSGIITSTGTLIFNSGSSVSGGSNTTHVTGTIRKLGNSDFTFPVGTGSRIAQLRISNFTVGDATTQFECNYSASVPTNSLSVTGALKKVSQLEYWNLNQTGGTAPTCNVTLYWADQTFSETNIAGGSASTDLVVAHFNGTNWESYGQSTYSNGASGFVGCSNVSSFSPFAFGSLHADIPLPVELFSFIGLTYNEKNKLNWITASEVNNDHFIVEKSADGVQFAALEKVSGKGNYNGTSEYQIFDENPHIPITYYRLKQVDFDGKIHFSDIVSVDRNLSEDQFNFSLFPNPINQNNSTFNIGFQKQSEQKTVLVVVKDISGREFYSKVIVIQQNDEAIISVDPNQQLSPGIYLVCASMENSFFNKKLIVR